MTYEPDYKSKIQQRYIDGEPLHMILERTTLKHETLLAIIRENSKSYAKLRNERVIKDPSDLPMIHVTLPKQFTDKVKKDFERSTEPTLHITDEEMTSHKISTSIDEVIAVYQKPPLGIPPRAIWEEERKRSISGCIVAYIEAELPIPIEWVEEWNERVKR